MAKASAVYEKIFGNVKALNRYMRMMYILPEVQKVHNADVLDIGCLDGHFTGYLLGRQNRVFAVDIRNGGVKRAYPEVLFTLARGERLPFKDNSFDFVFCSDVFEHIRNFEEIIPEIRRVLKPGKTCLISTVDGYWTPPLGIRKFFRKILPQGLRTKVMGAFAVSDEDLHRNYMGHVRYDITTDKLEGLFGKESFGVEVKKTYCHAFGSFLMEVFFSFTEGVRYATFPFLKMLLPLDKVITFGRPWQYYFIFKKAQA